MSLTLFEISIVTFPANSKAQIGWVTKSFCNAPNIDLRLEISNKNISNLTKQLTTKYYE